MFDKLLENLDLTEIAAKLGLPADQLQPLAESLKVNMEQGGDIMSALIQTAQQNGIQPEKLQEMIGGLGGSDDLLGKVASMLGGEGGLGDLANATKGWFGKD